MLNKTKTVLVAALIAVSATAALANDSGENDQGGYVVPGSTDGVNPAYHPDLFPNYPRSSEANRAYGYVPSVPQKHRVTHSRTQDQN